MKLFVIDPETGNKIYLDSSCATRRELAIKLGSKAFYANGKRFYVNNVQAEKSNDSTALGMVIGGALGLIGGAPGVLIGSAIGGALGNSNDEEEKEKVEMFNRSAV